MGKIHDILYEGFERGFRKETEYVPGEISDNVVYAVWAGCKAGFKRGVLLGIILGWLLCMVFQWLN